MAATLLGTVGVHGIASDETGMIIESLDDTSKKKSNFLIGKKGDRIGRADYDESIEISIKGKLTASSPWSQQISEALTLTNTISYTHLQSASGGMTLTDEVKRSRKNEEWNDIEVSAETLPFFV